MGGRYKRLEVHFFSHAVPLPSCTHTHIHSHVHTCCIAQAFLIRLDTLEKRAREISISIQKPAGENPPYVITPAAAH
jgi:hypothetical protein